MSRKLYGERDRAVYAWEHAHVDPHDSRLELGVVGPVVDYVWSQLGLLHPPRLKLDGDMDPREGSGNRIQLNLHPAPYLSVVLHELAHSMDVSLETSAGATAIRPESEVGGGSYHDENWLGLYVMLLDKHVGGRHFNYFWLMKSLQAYGLTMSLNPKPRCI